MALGDYVRTDPVWVGNQVKASARVEGVAGALHVSVPCSREMFDANPRYAEDGIDRTIRVAIKARLAEGGR